jgi:hypothetical protein
MVAMVHDNAQVPVIDIAGIELAPGRKHKLGYKKKTSGDASHVRSICWR